MEKVYEECSKLRDDFFKQEELKIPSYYWEIEEGDNYLLSDIYENLKKKADQYYKKCLDERSLRVTKNEL